MTIINFFNNNTLQFFTWFTFLLISLTLFYPSSSQKVYREGQKSDVLAPPFCVRKHKETGKTIGTGNWPVFPSMKHVFCPFMIWSLSFPILWYQMVGRNLQICACWRALMVKPYLPSTSIKHHLSLAGLCPMVNGPRCLARGWILGRVNFGACLDVLFLSFPCSAQRSLLHPSIFIPTTSIKFFITIKTISTTSLCQIGK